jgi:hypothetical protein
MQDSSEKKWAKDPQAIQKRTEREAQRKGIKARDSADLELYETTLRDLLQAKLQTALDKDGIDLTINKKQVHVAFASTISSLIDDVVADALIARRGQLGQPNIKKDEANTLDKKLGSVHGFSEYIGENKQLMPPDDHTVLHESWGTHTEKDKKWLAQQGLAETAINEARRTLVDIVADALVATKDRVPLPETPPRSSL